MLVKADSKPPTASHTTSWSTGPPSHNGPVWLGVHGQAGWKDCTRSQWCPQSHDLQSDHVGKSSHTCNTVASLTAWRTDYTCHHSHRLNEPPAKGGVWNGLPRLAHGHAPYSAAKTSMDLLPWSCRSLWEWTGRQTGKGHVSHVVCSSATKTFVDLLMSWARRSQWEWTGR